MRRLKCAPLRRLTAKPKGQKGWLANGDAHSTYTIYYRALKVELSSEPVTGREPYTRRKFWVDGVQYQRRTRRYKGTEISAP